MFEDGLRCGGGPRVSCCIAATWVELSKLNSSGSKASSKDLEVGVVGRAGNVMVSSE